MKKANTKQPLIVAAVQMESLPKDKEANFSTVTRFVTRAAKRGVNLVIFPECCLTGYWFIRNLAANELLKLAEPIPSGPSCRRLRQLAVEHGIAIGAGLIEKTPRALFNSYVIALPNGTLQVHRKLHAFEHSLIESGSRYTLFNAYGWKIAVLICYDCNIIENVRAVALQGADLLLAPHQTGGCRTKNPHLMGAIDRRLWDNRGKNRSAIEREFLGPKGRAWLMRWLPSRAHDNGLFLAFSNGVGVDDDEIRTGNAMILDPYGRVLTETHRADAAMVITTLDPNLLPASTGRLWLRARRPKLYSSLTKRSGLERDAREMKFKE